jgi:adenylate cyclase
VVYLRRERRREATIVCVDVVGYSAMIAADAEHTLDILRDCESRFLGPGIQSHGGRLFGHSGDNWLVEFPSPDAGLRFALYVQRSIAEDDRIKFRVGVNFGDLVEDEGTLHGNAINIAVRLQEIARVGGIALSSSVRSRIAHDIDCEFREIGPRSIKNIAKPVWVYRVVMSGEEDQAAFPHRSIIDVSREVPGLLNRPAIAVLPFENVALDAGNEYFADGLTEDIINGLAHVRWFPIIARNTSFQFRDKTADIREIGRQLGVRYIVGGSVWLSRVQVRVKAWVTETEEQHVIWSNHFGGALQDLFSLQDEIAEGIVGAIEPELSRAEQFRSRARMLEGLNEWELVRRGLWHMNRMTREDAAFARDLFDRALASNPASVEALIHLSWWHFWNVWAQRGPASGWVDMGRLARQARALDDRDARPFMLQGIAQSMLGEMHSGRNLLKVALQLNPSLAVAHACIGTNHILSGEPESAIKPLETAIRLSPNDFYIFHTLGEVAVARYMMGDYNLGLAAAEEALQIRPGYFYAHIVRVGCLARLGRLNEARTALVAFITRRPDFTVKDVEWLPFFDREWITYLLEGLRLAGFTTSGTLPT